MKSICNFVPDEEYKRDIQYYHFVYETETKALKQPFYFSNYHMSIVIKGTAEIKINNCVEIIKPGTIFFSFPHQLHQITPDDSFTFLYISFDGEGVQPLFKATRITKENSIYHNYEDLILFCMNALRRTSPSNVRIITESVLMYVLSYINQDTFSTKTKLDKFDNIISFTNNNFLDKDLTVKKIAEIFFYNEKYLSALFKSKMKVNFKQYLNKLRINHALEIMKDTTLSITEVAMQCGFSDSTYFSKVFKKYTGKSPLDYYKDKG